MHIEVNNQANNQVSEPTNNGSVEICFRCPHCQKLFKTSPDVFVDSSKTKLAEEFDCTNCAKPFLLKNKQDAFGLFMTSQITSQSFLVCPKCSSLKPHKSDECPTCGVFASKYILLQKTESPILFELNQQWQKILLNFDEDQYHQDFINKCHYKLALNFAFHKYSDLQKTVGFDVLCEKYIRQIELRLEQQLKASEGALASAAKNTGWQLSLTQYLFMSVGFLGMLLLIYNKFIPTFQNFNGWLFLFTIAAFTMGLFSRKQPTI